MVCTLTPSESKRLLGRAVARLDLVQRAAQTGKIFIGNGSTNAYVAEELFGVKLEARRFPSGVITGGVQCRAPGSNLAPLYFEAGRQVVPLPDKVPYEFMRNIVSDMRPGDLIIKGANAVDGQRNVGILLAHEQAGTIGVLLPIAAALGITIITPVGLEKMVSSVVEAGRARPGIHKSRYSLGHGVGYLVISNALVVTEIEALSILAGVEVVHLASGGIGGSEGAVTLLLKGSDPELERAFRLLQEVKGERRFRGWKQECESCSFGCDWQADQRSREGDDP